MMQLEARISECHEKVFAFGEDAERYARRLPQNVAVVLADGNQTQSLARAVVQAIKFRREGTPFFVAPLLGNMAGLRAREFALKIMSSNNNFDACRELFEALAESRLIVNNTVISEVPYFTSAVLGTMNELANIADAFLFRSQTERAYVESILNIRKSYVSIAPQADPTVPNVLPDHDADEIVVWAPNAQAHSLAMYIYALWELKKPALFVCNGEVPNTPHRFVDPSQAAGAIRRAAVIVDTDLSDPGTAITFADRNIGIVASKSCGAHEFLHGITTYDPVKFTEILGAVGRARANRRACSMFTPASSQELNDVLVATVPPIPDNPPLVSIVLPTYNRPSELRRCLDGFVKQTYPNFEVLVVNDCGESVEEIVAHYPFARYLTTPFNLGCNRANNFGFKATRGEYIASVADDDANYPNQISSLVAALLSSRLDVVYAHIILRLDTVAPDGHTTTCGHLVPNSTDHDPTAAWWDCSAGSVQGFMFRKKTFEALGYFNEELVATADVHAKIALSEKYDFAHADTVTGEMSFRDDLSNMSARMGTAHSDEYAMVFRKYAARDSALISSRQDTMIASMTAAQIKGLVYHPRIRLDPTIALP